MEVPNETKLGDPLDIVSSWQTNFSLMPPDPSPHISREELLLRLQRQVEYYFGDKNYPKDTFIQAHLEDGWFDLALLMSFPKIKQLKASVQDIAEALSMDSCTLIELNDEKTKIRRTSVVPVTNPLRLVFPKELDITDPSVFETIPSISENETILKHTVKIGAGPLPKPWGLCDLHWIAYNPETLEIVHNSRKTQELPVRAIIGKVPSDIDIRLECALSTMRVGEIAIFETVSLELDEFCTVVAQHKTRYRVEFLKLIQRTPQISGSLATMSFLEREQNALIEKNAGAELFKEKAFSQAARSYNKAIAYFAGYLSANATSEEETRRKNLLSILHCNVALCYQKDLNKLKFAETIDKRTASMIDHCAESLSLKPNNPKAIWLQACAHRERNELQSAKELIQKAYALSQSSTIIEEYTLIRKALAEENRPREYEDTVHAIVFTNTTNTKL